MSINATSNYMSNFEIVAWMQDKTEGLYGQMRTSMQGANERADAESTLDDIKAAITNSKDKDAAEVQTLIKGALNKYQDVPEVAQVLQPMLDELNRRDDQRGRYANTPVEVITGPEGETTMQLPPTPPAVTISSNDVDAWTKQISDKVDALGKQDSLAMINIQEFNSQINQAKQTASALLDAADKSSNTIINHIA